MRKFLTVLVAATFLSLGPSNAWAQTDSQEEMVSVPRSSLTTQQKAQLAADETTEKLQSVNGWVGIGHEIGTAVNESLIAVTDGAERFANTDVGKLTMLTVVYKVIGADLFQKVFGFFVFLPLLCYMNARIWFPMYTSRRVLKKKEKGVREWEVVPALMSSQDSSERKDALVGACLLTTGSFIGWILVTLT